MSRLHNLERKLATILAADVAGFSRLMGADEEGTLQILTAYRDIIDATVREHRGRIFGSAGDSVVAEFASPVAAVRCAVAFQDALAGKNAELPEDRRMRFRVGVNLGDVLVSGDDLLGDGVNVAARLEGLAEAGEICVSGSVHEQVKGRVDNPFQDLGEQDLKNIDHPVRVFRVLSGREDDVAPPPAGHGGDASARPSIAVLPFDNLGGDPEQAYFADGITEDLITELTRFQELSVVARNTVFAYRNAPADVRQVGRDLGVRYVLEGSVRKAGDRVRVTAQLIDGESGHHLWAERFDRTFEDVFDVQDEVTRRIVASLAGKVSESERRRARTGRSADRTAHPQAYDLVLQGRELWFKFSDEKNRNARALYEQAIALDPEYARAYASLAWTYLVEYENRWSDDPQSSYAKALEFARKGVSVNPASHSNHLTLGQVYLWHGEHAMAIEALKTGLRLNPNDLDGYVFLARALAFDGQHDMAVKKVQTAVDVASNVPEWYYWVMGMTLTMARRYDEAVAAIDHMRDPGHNALRWRAVCRHHQGRDDDARRTMAEILRLKPDFSLARHMETMPFRLADDRAHYEDALKAAGAPA